MRGLYLLTRETADDARLRGTVRAALEGGAMLVQYRDKSRDAVRRRVQASSLLALCREFLVPLIVNDDVALARAVGADGVHVGRDDASLAEARAALGPAAIVGVSCYDDLDRANDAAANGASYVAFGSFFASPTKPGARRASPSLLADARHLAVPKVAIGGLTPDNAAALVAAGADLLAVSSAIFDAPDPRAAARAFAALYQRTPT